MYPRTNSWLYVKPEHKPGFHDFGFLPKMLFAFLKHLFACKNSILWPHESLLENSLSQYIYIFLVTKYIRGSHRAKKNKFMNFPSVQPSFSRPKC